MLAYAASRPPVIDRRPYPNAMLLIIGAHVAVAALVMSAKMEIDRQKPEPPIIVDTIKPKPDPTPIPQTNQSNQATRSVTRTDSVVKTQPTDLPPLNLGQTKIDPGPMVGGGALVVPEIRPVVPVSSGPRLLTPVSELKPPYPPSKLLNEEEAILTVKLTIDENGRVIAVNPVGRADAAFLDAARRHLMAHWRYKPASEDGRAVVSSAVVTLHFELDG
jgi:protein TonB